MCQSVIFGSLTLRKARALDFGVKLSFSKIRMEPVMHDFLGKVAIAGKLQEKSVGNCYSQFPSQQ